MIIVIDHILFASNSAHYVDHGKGMRPLENRHIVLKCFEAFKFVMVSHFIYVSTYPAVSDLDGF
ncbi:hypothetical protein GALMADRAFT_256555 [Galerina marginata CBS 339.88]|uniref:Uncharacterized protein n=1 Tax=Galerina marginata (strain CBS 339.88) TaxID=685588 RepID=A0A067SCW7_GALM3|nr:hypothetical protein GALMADRAFT_256555 [Galerina marginata CBS 339.88]